MQILVEIKCQPGGKIDREVPSTVRRRTVFCPFHAVPMGIFSPKDHGLTAVAPVLPRQEMLPGVCILGSQGCRNKIPQTV